MRNTAPHPDSKGTGSPPKNRRSGVRHICRVKILFNKNKSGADDETWCVGKVVDVSLRGIALITSRLYFPGTMLMLTPIMPGWKHDRQLQARVTNVRQEPGQSWCAGCEFASPLNEDELQMFLQNSKLADMSPFQQS
jgi:hypothetical protein